MVYAQTYRFASNPPLAWADPITHTITRLSEVIPSHKPIYHWSSTLWTASAHSSHSLRWAYYTPLSEYFIGYCGKVGGYPNGPCKP